MASATVWSHGFAVGADVVVAGAFVARGVVARGVVAGVVGAEVAETEVVEPPLLHAAASSVTPIAAATTRRISSTGAW
jgi:hypothetical protein